jgi:hypothetical protein
MQIGLQKVQVECFVKINEKDFDVSFSSFSFGPRCQVLPGDGSSKPPQKNVLQKKRVEKCLQSNRQNNPTSIFSRIILSLF